jgi:hypothetical protein
MEVSYKISTKSVKQYGIHGYVHLCPHVNQALLRLRRAENWNFHATVLNKSLPYQMRRISSGLGADTRAQTQSPNKAFFRL